jgi:hypothetical protein
MSATAIQWNQIFQYEDGQTVHTVERGSPAVTSGPSRKPPSSQAITTSVVMRGGLKR